MYYLRQAQMFMTGIFAATTLLTATVVHSCEPVNVNTAGASELAKALDGVGPKKAEAIIKQREDGGDFANADDLMETWGIGEKTIEKNQDCIQYQSKAKAE